MNETIRKLLTDLRWDLAQQCSEYGMEPCPKDENDFELREQDMILRIDNALKEG